MRKLLPERFRHGKHLRTRAGKDFSVTHRIQAEGAWHAAGVSVHSEPVFPPEDGLETFLKEEAWGLGRSRSGGLLRYRVEHSPWRVSPVEDWTLDVDFPRLYGPAWAFLNDAVPLSVLCAEGSPVRVYPCA